MALLLPSQVLASPQCADAVGCERKFCEMERQIDEAEKQGNRRQAAGLETALAEARKSCTDTSLYQDMAEDIDASESDLAEYREDLEQARREGDTRKVAKYLQKIEEEKEELEALKREQADAMHPKEGGGMVAP
ncbi:MAG: DUF1090 domain-containing protein [Pseudomonadota bacterium]|nr:DUF1090 domain-containing protein [Pseudomonadota bacterium]MEE2871134.1 DUF1090 domain-containing protein [Pseudomonadota bacterium]